MDPQQLKMLPRESLEPHRSDDIPPSEDKRQVYVVVSGGPLKPCALLDRDYVKIGHCTADDAASLIDEAGGALTVWRDWDAGALHLVHESMRPDPGGTCIGFWLDAAGHRKGDGVTLGTWQHEDWQQVVGVTDEPGK